MNTVNNVISRLVYDNARIAVANAFSNDPNFNIELYKLTQSYLRLEQVAVTNKTQYTFPVLVNQQNPTNTEQRLNLQDSFVIAQLGMFVCLPSSGTDAAYPLLTWNDPLSFATGADALYTLYNGYLQISVNNSVIIPSWDLFRHYQVNQTQLATLPATTSPTQNQLDGSSDAFYPVEPNIILVGSKNNVITVNIPAAFAAIDAGTRIVLYMRGILAQNSTVVS